MTAADTCAHAAGHVAAQCAGSGIGLAGGLVVLVSIVGFMALTVLVAIVVGDAQLERERH